MIRAIELGEFKCFRDCTLPLGALTVLTGTNGSGKSTVIQALLALRQSFEQDALRAGKLALNGDWVRLGTGRDVLNDDAEGAMRIGLHADNVTVWHFAHAKDAEELLVDGEAPALPNLALFSANFQYLCAERIGPRASFAMADHQVRVLRQLGAAGQYTAQFLTEFGAEPVAIAELVQPEAGSKTLLRQTEAWLGVVSEGARIYTQTHRAMDVAQLQFAFAHPLGESNRYRPTNVGFGLTYALPVIVAVLAARAGDLVIVENPEAHLHPQGQAELGRFLAIAAAAGIQVVVETHSDHVLNGVRVAVKDRLLAPESVLVHFFTWRRDGQQAGHFVHSPKMDRDGRIDAWPAGFFDQWDLALEKLL